MKQLLVVPLLGLLSSGVIAAEVRDPMRPPSAVAATTGVEGLRPRLVPTQVTALFISSERRAAVVDGRLVRVGENSGLCHVEEILEDGVRCRFPRGVRVVRLPRTEYTFKKPAAAAVAANGVP
jgi:hypothetical protein